MHLSPGLYPCSRPGCARPCAKNPRTGARHRHCSLRCKRLHEDGFKDDSEGEAPNLLAGDHRTLHVYARTLQHGTLTMTIVEFLRTLSKKEQVDSFFILIGIQDVFTILNDGWLSEYDGSSLENDSRWFRTACGILSSLSDGFRRCSGTDAFYVKPKQIVGYAKNFKASCKRV